MINAFVNIKCDKKAFSKISKELLSIKGVTEVHAITGDYDILVILRAKSHEIVSKVVTEEVLEIDNIIDTNTVIALASFSNYQIEEIYKDSIY